MKRNILGTVLLHFLVVTFFASPATGSQKTVTLKNADIVGAGATFPAPLYRRWIKEFTKTSDSFTIFYDAVGSGDGISRFMAEEVDFGASDSAMQDQQMAKVTKGVQLIPATAGIIAIAYNLPNLAKKLRLDRATYTDIFLGKIRYWDDNRITALNPDSDFPHLNITTVTRSDSSGTTWAFTNHLHTISSEWRKSNLGVGKKVDWPGNSMSARYNEGVAGKIKYSRGAIGYVEYGTAMRAGLSMASLENKEGYFVAPSDSSGTKTLENTVVEMPPNLRLFIPDPTGVDSYPLITYSWLLLYQKYADGETAKKVKSFVDWGLTEGQRFSAELGYTPLPGTVITAARKALANIN